MKEEYDKIVAEIGRLQTRKSELEKLMLESTDSFIDKFRLWYNSEDECHHSWMIDEDVFPLLRAEFDKRVDTPRRGKTYEVDSLIGHDDALFNDIVNPSNKIYKYKKGEYEKLLEEFLSEYQPLMEEAMKGEMKSFEADW